MELFCLLQRIFIPDAPKNEKELIQIILMGKSIVHGLFITKPAYLFISKSRTSSVLLNVRYVAKKTFT